MSTLFEDYNITATPFYPHNPRVAARYNKIPWINGANINAGSVFVCFIYSYPDYVERVKSNLRRYLQIRLSLETYFFEQDVPQVLEEILNHYFKDEFSQKALIRVFSDRFFLIPFANTAIEHGGQVYAYVDDYLFRQSYVDRFGPPSAVKTKPGISDILQFFYRLRQIFPERVDSAATVGASQTALDLWTSFIINGNPTSKCSDITWNPLKTEKMFNFLFLDNSQRFGEKYNPFRGSYRFWEYLRKKYGTQY